MIQPPQWKSKATGQIVLIADGWDDYYNYYIAVWLGKDKYMEKKPDAKLKIAEFLQAFERADDLPEL
jgi:hypothetical protein